MNKKENQVISDTAMMADALLKLKSLENLCISKGLFTREEFLNEMSQVSNVILKEILKKANVPGDLDQLIANLPVNV